MLTPEHPIYVFEETEQGDRLAKTFELDCASFEETFKKAEAWIFAQYQATHYSAKSPDYKIVSRYGSLEI